jgi:hypothetical protein
MTDYYDDNKEKKVEDESEELFDKGRADLIEEKGLDPIKTYMKEMGAIPRLTREQEIETAKNIDAARNKIIKSILNIPLTYKAIVEKYHKEQTVQNIEVGSKPFSSIRSARPLSNNSSLSSSTFFSLLSS